MMRFSSVLFAAIFLSLLFGMPRPALAQDSAAGAGKLEVHVKYEGPGTVDEKHKIYVVLWDSPDFISGGGTAPVAVLSMSSNGGTVTFADVKKSPAYVSAVFDAKGTWDLAGPPPDGSPLGLYMKTPGQPEPIEIKAGKTVTIEFSFDDSIKMGG